MLDEERKLQLLALSRIEDLKKSVNLKTLLSRFNNSPEEIFKQNASSLAAASGMSFVLAQKLIASFDLAMKHAGKQMEFAAKNNFSSVTFLDEDYPANLLECADFPPFLFYKGKNIYDILEMRVEEALHFFENRPQIARKLQTLYDVGLGYIKLGQPATTLSGGEAERVKLANELQRRPTGKSIYLIDEPTTGLHMDDVSRLVKILQTLVDQGETVVVIEHNLDIIKVADWVIDLGPDGGDAGGYIIAQGTPEDVASCENSYTGEYLRKLFMKE